MQSPDDADKYQPEEIPAPAGLGADVVVSPDVHRPQRVPPGQSRTRKWPVLHYGGVPKVELQAWTLEVVGEVGRPLRFGWDEFQQLPRVRVFSDFHCVTRWSRLGNLWEGVATRELLERAELRPEAEYVILHGYDGGFTTNLPLDDFLAGDALLAFLHDGRPLTAEHGGPVRAVIPRLYAWKSAKWLKAVELSRTDRPGYWERGGYHNHGDPWTEERFG